MSTLERAIAIAAEAHAGQTDKAGVPYILHPLRVMLGVDAHDERIAAVLHDVLEDCPAWSLGRLAAEGFSTPVLNALAALTRQKGESYEAFIDRVCDSRIAINVKMADLKDNLEPVRLGLITPNPERVAKYRAALAKLAPPRQ